MKLSWLLLGCTLVAASAATASILTAAPPTNPAPSKNRSLAINPAASSELWVINKENNAVVVTNRNTGAILATIALGVNPRNIAFNSTGTRAYVTNQRGNVSVDKTLLEYTGTEILGSVSVIDTATKTVVNTITTGIGVEPYGIALAPNGKYLLVSNARSSSLSVIDPATDTVVASLQYAANLGMIPNGMTAADLDANNDFIADFEAPRGLAIRSTSDRAYVAHLRSGYISVVSLTLNGSGVPTALSVAKRINLNKYNFDAFVNPTQITQAKSQGNTRFNDDVTISPDGTRLWTAHELLNVNHDVNVPFSPGHFANRVYGSVSIVDLTTETFEEGDVVQTDGSDRLHFDWNVPAVPTAAIQYGLSSGPPTRRIATLRGTNAPVLGTTFTLAIEHGSPNAPYTVFVGRTEANIPQGGGGTMLLNVLGAIAGGNTNANGVANVNVNIPNNLALSGTSLYYQAVVSGGPVVYTNGVRAMLGPVSGTIPSSTLPVRIAQPSRVEFSPDGRRALVLSRGSEDVAVFDVTGAAPVWMGVTPRRDSTPSPTQLDKNHTQFSANRLVGDRPTGMLISDFDVRNDLAKLYINNEISRDVARDIVNFTTGVVGATQSVIALIPPGNDMFTLSERIGAELFADGSRDQTTGNFSVSCESCHYEGGEDGNVWQRDNGPRSTIPMYGGIRRTGLLLWKGNRMNLGETGPMFGGENGGTGIFTDAEQEGLTDYHNKIAVPLNPNLVNSQLSVDAAIGRDLYFGIDDTGSNPLFRNSNCASCHPIILPTGEPAWFTNDQMKLLDTNFDMAHQDPCLSLKESINGESVQDVNSGVNLEDDFGVTIIDRNNDTISDIEGYNPANIDKTGDFTRDDPNSIDCDDPGNPGNPLVFTRQAGKFNIPTKMGVLFTSPYFHDHAVGSLRAVLDPLSQTFPPLNKLRNTQHDLRGTNVQQFLSSSNINDDIELLLKFMQSL
ncbi:MAG: YncE family protein [Planctomycetota bacterium]